jgi:hypothetical protein
MIKTNRRFILILLAVVVLLIALPILGLSTLLWYRTWTPWCDDGPFHGKQRTDVPAKQPDQIFSIYRGMKLYVYDPGPNEPAPTVLLKSKENKVLWCIYAEAESMPDTKVVSIRFDDYRHFPFKRSRVIGVVNWTFGNEGAWWFIDKNGTLEEYWYSW